MRELLGMAGRLDSRPLGVDSGPGEGSLGGVRGAAELYDKIYFHSRPHQPRSIKGQAPLLPVMNLLGKGVGGRSYLLFIRRTNTDLPHAW